MDERGVSTVIGVTLVVVITLLLASMFAAGMVNMTDFGTERKLVGGLTDGDEAAPGDGAGAGGDDGYRSELIWARNESPLTTTNHVVNYTIADDSDTAGNSLNNVVIEYPDGSADVSAIGERDDIVMVGIDGDRDGTIETEATGDIECCPTDDGVIIKDGGTTLRIELSGNYNLEGGDSLIVEYRATDNPGTGDYSVTVDVNGDVSDTGTLEIGDD
ncbi:type IV pilin [Haloplanus halobius]|uniref:type IV pilin n=1 Tax=Haloplanus halobius TaxID=2934938 RepID=UPI00200CB2AA|nr:type IV pilin [Haloplanus sp. XH21]